MEQNILTIETQDEGLKKLMEDNTKLNTNLAMMKVDIDKLKTQMNDKVSKMILSELESKINAHSKAIESLSRKLYEINNNVNTFVQQPVSQTLIETMKKQLSNDILHALQPIIEHKNMEINKNFDDKITELRNQINNTKKFIYR